MTLQERIEKFEKEGWKYEPEFRLHTRGNTIIQFMALTKDGYYRKIQSGKIGPAKSIRVMRILNL